MICFFSRYPRSLNWKQPGLSLKIGRHEFCDFVRGRVLHAGIHPEKEKDKEEGAKWKGMGCFLDFKY